MEINKLKDFIKFMDDNNLCELEIEEEGKRIRLKKNVHEQVVSISHAVNPEKLVKETPKEKEKENILEIKSPMVGTFYRAPSPGAKPYVDIGEIIKPGDVVCIIEAMKLMNEIKAEVGGEVIGIPVNNSEPVEFGQTLFTIRPLQQ